MNWPQHPGRVDVFASGKMGLRSAYLNGFKKYWMAARKPLSRWMRIFHDPSVLVMAKLLESCDIVLVLVT
jgi:hypothetical protein